MTIEEKRQAIKCYCDNHETCDDSCPLSAAPLCYSTDLSDYDIERNYNRIFDENGDIRPEAMIPIDSPTETVDKTTETVDKSISVDEKLRAITEYCKGTFCEDCVLFNNGNLCDSESIDYNYAVLF